MQNLVTIIDNINDAMDKYLFRILSAKEETEFNNLLVTRDAAQSVVRDNINIEDYIKKVYTDKQEAISDKHFLKKYANVETELFIHPYKYKNFRVWYSLRLLQEVEEITSEDMPDYISSYIY